MNGKALKKILGRLRTPRDIQDYLDKLPYRSEDDYCSPARVVSDGRAHCFDGALFAACALGTLGQPPRIVDLKAWHDDDHVIAVYRKGNCFGSIGKSNFTGLGYREPVYRSIRELAISYFNDYFNSKGERTLRAYSVPLSLEAYDAIEWRTEEKDLIQIVERLESLRHFSLILPGVKLTKVDKRTLRAGLLGANEAGLYRS